MTLRLRLPARAIIACAAASGLAIGTAVSVMAISGFGPFGSSTQPALDPAAVSPPAFSNWIRPDNGRFEAYTWDDRPIAPSEKAAQPWYDARWKPFSDCMDAAGFETRADASKPFGQADLDGLIAKLNGLNPDGAANKTKLAAHTFSGVTEAFLGCADKWLAIHPKDMAKHGLHPLDPGEIPSS